jgi:5-methylcytosine-specific restriction endonuclease McrA
MAGGKFQGSTRRSRLPADWVKRRAKVLKRDGYICHVCKGPGADGVDHIVPGDDHSLDNLAAIHHRVAPYCHRTKSSSEGGLAAQAKKIPRRRPPEQHPGLI